MTMKKFLYMAVAAIAALSSCSSDDIVSGEKGNGVSNANAPVFTATIESKAASRTTLVDGKKVNWANGDAISINGVTYSTTSTAETATFTTSAAAPEAVDGKYYAVYPSSIAFNTSTQTLTLPATQTYDATTNGIGNVPMVAVSEDTELQFKNICAVLAIKVASGTVKAIKVMADKKNLSGDFTLDPSTSAITATTTGSNTVVLECGEGVTADNTTFYIAIPPQEYSSLQIYLSADGSTYKEAMATKVAVGLGAIARNTILPITYAKNAVQLWADGPYFATTNVGGTQKYQWGATAAGGTGNYTAASSGAITANTYDLNHDTAYKLWGSAWRMPTKEECAALIDNCDWVCNYSTIAFDLSSKTSGYGSISLPGEDLGSSYYANYWTSSVNNNGEPYSLGISETGGGTKMAGAGAGTSPADKYYVRAVLATPAPVPDPNLLTVEFSVSATKKVKFTKGNLYWDGSAYAFEENQGACPNTWGEGDNAGKHVGHFYWTKTAANSYGSSYSDDTYTSEDIPFFAESKGGLTVNGTSNLYVLSSEEWTYLLNTRTMTNGKDRYKNSIQSKEGLGDVYHAYQGLYIYPDNYNGSYNEADMDAINNAGIVFLPPAGGRDKNSIFTYYGSIGFYWSATQSSYDNGKAIGPGFSDQGVAIGDDVRNYARSIRLVKTVQ